jgi:hypothetical protein
MGVIRPGRAGLFMMGQRQKGGNQNVGPAEDPCGPGRFQRGLLVHRLKQKVQEVG